MYSNTYLKNGTENVIPCMSLECTKHKNTLIESHMVPRCNEEQIESYNYILHY